MAVLVCDKKVLTQDAPYGTPETKASMCLGCLRCIQACSKGAIHML